MNGHEPLRFAGEHPTVTSIESAALALGTVQFGMPYGIAGRGEAVPEGEVRTILEHAARGGIRVLDTAPAYGDIEARLRLLVTDLGFGVVSKISALPGLLDAADAERFVATSVERSVLSLGSCLTTLLFHRAEDLLATHGDILWRAAAEASEGKIRLGVSCYDPATAVEVRRRYPISVAQVPGNVFDQRLRKPGVCESLHDVEIHLRCVFLQGLLLMPLEAALSRVPAAARAMTAWVNWCERRTLRPVSAALSIARALPGVRFCVVGIDRLGQLQEILASWVELARSPAPSLACDSLDIIDPRRWTAA